MALSQMNGYAPEECASCEGVGYGVDGRCRPCGGKGVLLVYQPARQCPHCGGSGEATPEDKRVYLSRHCSVCLGSGWALTLNGFAQKVY